MVIVKDVAGNGHLVVPNTEEHVGLIGTRIFVQGVAIILRDLGPTEIFPQLDIAPYTAEAPDFKISMLSTAASGIVLISTNVPPSTLVTRRPSSRTRLAPGSNARNATEENPTGPPWLVPLFAIGILFELFTG
jgi:hypothetical protein